MNYSKYFCASNNEGPDNDEMSVYIDRGASMTIVTDEDGVAIYGDPAAFKAMVEAITTLTSEEVA